MKNITKLVLLMVLIISISCEKTLNGYKYETGTLPETPVNLADFNTEYDDYNSTAPSLGDLIPFCFSTNRNSQGNVFDIIYQPMNVNFDKTTGILKITNEYANWGVYMDDYEIIKSGITKIKTTGNDLYYSTLENGVWSEPINFGEKINTEFDEYRPILINEGVSRDQTMMVFSSNRPGGFGGFDLYFVGIDMNK